MKVLQLIDSLNPGGAERMAVNLANSLVGQVEFSGICVSREEGILKEKLNPEAGFVFLNKKTTLDYRAIKKLNKYIRKNKVNILHTHGPSFFLGVIIKIINPNLRLIWHDHFGKRATRDISSFPVLKIASNFFSGIIVVNNDLRKWSKKNLRCKRVIFFPNFLSSEKNIQGEVGNKQKISIDIVYLANLKDPKNHLNLLKAFKIVVEQKPDSSLYLIGENYEDAYSKKIYEFLFKNDLQDRVVLTGKETNVFKYLNNAKVGVISSNSEGLPMALLEYGMAGIAVVTTDVGACGEVLGENGKIVDKNNPTALAENLIFYLKNEDQRKCDAERFNKFVKQNYSDRTIIPQIIEYYSEIEKN